MILFGAFAALPLFAETPSERLAERFADVQSQETALRARYATLRAAGRDAESIAKHVKEEMAKLTDAERAEIKKGKLSPATKAKIAPLTAFVQDADRELKAFHADYDKFNEAKLDFFVEKYRQLATDMIAESQGTGPLANLTDAQKKRLVEIQAKMEEQYKKYQDNKGKMGTPQDNDRLSGYRTFFRQLDQLVDVGRVPFRTWGDRLHELADKAENLLNLAEMVIGAVPRMVPIAAALTGRHNIIPRAGDLVSALVGSNGLRVDVEGRQNIPKPPHKKALNVLVFNHSNPVLDVAALTKLGLKKTAVLAASTDKMPEGIQKSLEENPGLVMVWGGRNPLKKILPMLESGELENLVVFPEASLHSGVGYELRPPMDNFTSKLLPILRLKGVEVNLIPVTSTRNFRLREDWRHSDFDSHHLPVVVHESFAPEVLDLMYAAGDPLTAARIIRQRWMDGMQDDPLLKKRDHFLGMPPVATIDSNLTSRFAKKRSCGKMFRDMQERGAAYLAPRG